MFLRNTRLVAILVALILRILSMFPSVRVFLLTYLITLTQKHLLQNEPP